jgi:hypothetical protein
MTAAATSIRPNSSSPGGREVIDYPQRGNHHDDVSLVVSGCLVALASPVTGAEAFIEFYRRQVEEPWRFSYNTDTDPIAAPQHGWQMADGPLLDVVVPAVIAAEGKVGNFTIRRMGDQAVVSMALGEAAERLRNPVWAKLNEALAKELLGEDATVTNPASRLGHREGS